MTEVSKKSSHEDRLVRFRNLSMKINEARKSNVKEMKEEEKRNKLPSNWEAKQNQLKLEQEEEALKKECVENGEDFKLVRMRQWGAEEVERWDARKKKKNPDPGFSDFGQASYRQYQRQTRQMKPDLEAYEQEKEKLGEDIFYAGAHTLGVLNHKDTDENIDRMVDDLNKQVQKRASYRRRRTYNDESDIDFINERNRRFNVKLDRFYGQYTAETKQNLERGTAI